MKKTVILVDTLGFGGSERSVQILAKNYEDIHCIVSLSNVICYEFPPKVKIITILNRNYPGYIKIFLWPFILFKLVIILRKLKPEIVVSFHFFSNILNVVCSKLNKYKSFLSERQYSQEYFGAKNLVFKRLIPLVYNSSNGIICNDKDIKESLINFYKVKTKILVLNNLFDSSIVKKPIITKNDAIFRFLTVGRLSNEKNTIDIIKAFSLIKRKEDIELIIVGDGPNSEKLKLLTKNLNLNVKFIGHSNDVSKYYNLCDAFVFSSLNEGFPNVILEAMAFGLPIISYKFKAGIRTILGNNEFGILIPLKDVTYLSKKMEEIIENKVLFQTLSKKSFERVKQFSDKNAYISKFKSFIENE